LKSTSKKFNATISTAYIVGGLIFTRWELLIATSLFFDSHEKRNRKDAIIKNLYIGQPSKINISPYY